MTSRLIYRWSRFICKNVTIYRCSWFNYHNCLWPWPVQPRMKLQTEDFLVLGWALTLLLPFHAIVRRRACIRNRPIAPLETPLLWDWIACIKHKRRVSQNYIVVGFCKAFREISSMLRIRSGPHCFSLIPLLTSAVNFKLRLTSSRSLIAQSQAVWSIIIDIMNCTEAIGSSSRKPSSFRPSIQVFHSQVDLQVDSKSIL